MLAACLLFSSAGTAQTDTLEALNARAMQAYQAKDYPSFLALEKQLLALTPGDPRVLYNMASGEALLGHPTESVALLDRLLKLQMDFHAEKDHDFDGIRKTPSWSQYQEHLAAMRKPAISSSVAFTLPEKGLLASSVAQDEARGDCYIGSLRERKILKRTKAGVVSDFATEKDGLMGVSSLLVDTAHNQLFAGTAAVPFMQNYRKEDDGKAGILVFDLSTGKLIRSAFIAEPGEHHVPAQLAEDKDGNLFVLDTSSSEIRKLRRLSTELELFLSSVVFQAPRGLALSADERTLYVLDLATGIWAVDVLSIDRVLVEASPEVWMGGLLGLARIADGFVSLETGVQPNRVVKIRLVEKGDAKSEKITAMETLENNHPAYESPMPGTPTAGDLLYVANSQLDLIDAKTGAFAAERAKETIVLRLPLKTP